MGVKGYLNDQGVFVAYKNQYSGNQRTQGNYNQNQNQPKKKHTGCKFGSTKDGVPYISAWNASKSRGMISMIASPYKGTKTKKSKTGKTWENWFVKITMKNTMDIKNFSGLYNVDNQKLYIKDLNMVANPKAPNGGYFGQHVSRRK
jgi:hypothetical protein